MTRDSRWGGAGENSYWFRNFNNCSAGVCYRIGRWDFDIGKNYNCEQIIDQISECRQTCDSLQLVDLYIYSPPTHYLFGYRLSCINTYGIAERYNEKSTYKFIYLVSDFGYFKNIELISLENSFFKYKDHTFILSRY